MNVFRRAKFCNKILLKITNICIVLLFSTASIVILSTDSIIEKYTNEKIIRSKEIIKNYYINKYSLNKIEVNNQPGNVIVQLDSYQQNKFENSTPKCTIDFSYERVAHVGDKEYNSISSSKQLLEILNDSTDNFWSYNVSSWWAKAKKRYMGNNIIMPAWAPEVYTKHNAKIYEYDSIEFMQQDKDFLCDILLLVVDDFAEIISDKINNSNINKNIISSLLRQLINKFKNSKLNNTKLKPTIINDNDYSLEFVDFGKYKIKLINTETLNFQSSNFVPIFDYENHEKCSGPTCSHNIGNLVNVILTNVVNLSFEHFGSNDALDKIFRFFIVNFIKFFISQNLGRTISLFLKWSDNHDHIINKLSKYFLQNNKRILLNYFGKVEKHGIQLGKCGNLVSGIKIDRNDNVITTNNDKPLLIFKGSVNHLFDIENNTYNFNFFHCAKELSNYKYLYDFLKRANIDNDTKNILLSNITNLSLPSDVIYNDYLNYINNHTKVHSCKVKLNSFVQFEKDGFKIPNQIQYWDLLNDYIIPQLLSKTYISKNENQLNFDIFYEDFDFTNTKLNKSNELVATNSFKELLRFQLLWLKKRR